MIIVSQDKETIMNFERINFIRIEDMYQIVANYADDYYEHLGSYDTEKRAKEILEEIVNTYVRECKTYNMPED